jgi:RNA polymerase sigma-70 factor (ECF subfamily)
MDVTAHERSLVLRAQSGDRAAFDELLRRVDQALLRYIATLLAGSRVSAEDVLQDVLITVVRKIGWLRDPALFRPWVFRIASRAAFRILKRERPSEQLTEEHAGPEVHPPDPWLQRRLVELLPRLTEASRAVIHLHYVEDMPLSDVAAALEINVGTVKSRLAYGLARLRKELG